MCMIHESKWLQIGNIARQRYAYNLTDLDYSRVKVARGWR
jgi:hypothetical protein